MFSPARIMFAEPIFYALTISKPALAKCLSETNVSVRKRNKRLAFRAVFEKVQCASKLTFLLLFCGLYCQKDGL